eukprot:CAMPEP_0175939504 /NCGR_PEP_ID=MMETSP0108-20121206/23296_1 /TAXON_ID=195067 ORGANISM="Goniomonas pacifica, Strain CCMP1869" /NCGR_SAMPLE_ID=MMETSP0108 /ASSEMBLY_ACC=CAM_ASM_000204 /LENGTH=515 /DNA_ID=CAMNT_0017263889 /DNA_START=63 /DNA_END=1610 /DNA_ORIENTATION=+
MEQQQADYAPKVDELTDDNCTMRAAPFADPTGTLRHTRYQWPILSVEDKKKGKSVWIPSMRDVIGNSMNMSNWKAFCTVEAKSGGDPNWSVESPHNKLHNYTGGWYHHSDQYGEVTGQMAQNQSIFDPVFWLHHSNIERLLLSWQHRWVNADGETKDGHPEALPPDSHMDTTLYPFTKPNLLYDDQLSWNTDPGKDNDGTFRDWWPWGQLRYTYDNFQNPEEPVNIHPPESLRVRGVSVDRQQLTLHLNKTRGGMFELLVDGTVVRVIDLLSNAFTLCPRCHSKEDTVIIFDVTSLQLDPDALPPLSVRRNGMDMDIIKPPHLGRWDVPDPSSSFICQGKAHTWPHGQPPLLVYALDPRLTEATIHAVEAWQGQSVKVKVARNEREANVLVVAACLGGLGSGESRPGAFSSHQKHGQFHPGFHAFKHQREPTSDVIWLFVDEDVIESETVDENLVVEHLLGHALGEGHADSSIHDAVFRNKSKKRGKSESAKERKGSEARASKAPRKTPTRRSRR